MKKKAKDAVAMPQIEEVPIGDVKPYANNPRFNEDAVPVVAESIREFGWQQPLVIDADGTIVVGHTRYLAALSLGMKSVPCVRASSLTPEQIRAYRLVDNKTNELATWDDMKLDEEIDALPDYDLTRFGFKFDSADALDAAFGDGGEVGDEDYRDADKINIKLPHEHIEKVREWMRNGGREKVVKFILVGAGCVGDDYEVPDDLAEGTEDGE